MSCEAAVPKVVSTSPAQSEAWSQKRLPSPEEVGDGVWAIASPIPHGSIPHTLSYLLEGPNGELALVDPGWHSEENLTVLRDSLEGLGHRLEQLTTVIVTHFHPDHIGIAARLRGITGARILFSATERRVLAQEGALASRDLDSYARTLRRWGVPDAHRAELIAAFDRPPWVADLEPDALLADGDIIELPGHTLRVIGTPGHTDGHICLADEERGLLFTGDHVMPRIYGGIGIGTLEGSEPLGDYFDSLDRLAPFDDYEVLPGHEFRFTGLGARRTQIARHHLRRSAEVSTLSAREPAATIWGLAQRMVWTGGWESLTGFMLDSALRQTEMHLGLVRSGRAAELLERFAPSAPRVDQAKA